MYDVVWDPETGGVLLSESSCESLKVEIRPVFHEELDLLNFDANWAYPKTRAPLLWATPNRRYFYKGELVAEARGGGFFERPEVEFYKKNLCLSPVEVSQMLAKNSMLLQGLAHRAVEFIHETQEKYRSKVDITAVAFSGGKDSLVLLDLVQRALLPSEFVVVFSDTTMEVPSTLEAVERSQERWNSLRFKIAKSSKDAQTSWREFGPPSRIHRWCCSVHKSAPTLLLLRDLINKPSVRALVYDGIRWEESQARSGYNPITIAGKHHTQINASPVLKWNAAEIFLYAFQRDILLNNAYRYGLVRVGCAVCPLASKWWDSISWLVWQDEIKGFIQILEDYGRAKSLEETEVRKFITDGGWKGRAGGRALEEGGNKVIQSEHSSILSFAIRHPKEQWLEWAKPLGKIVRHGENKGEIQNGTSTYPFTFTRYEKGLEVEIHGINRADRSFLSHLKAVSFKTAYCIHCRACEVECPTGALKTDRKVQIDENSCSHCKNCLSFTDKGCLAAKSLAVSKEGIRMKGLNRYQHFGMRTIWLHEFFEDPDHWWRENSLGNRQFEAMRVWLREAEIVARNKITSLGLKLKVLGADSPLCWAVIWTNLVRNSVLVNWYVVNVPWQSKHTKTDFIDMLDKNLAPSSRENAITSLVGLLQNTPLGSNLGLGVVEHGEKRTITVNKRGWDDAHPLAVLYSLYRYAEKLGRYSFSLSELFDQPSEGPHLLFGVSRTYLSRLIRGSSSRYESYLTSELVRDLDNIHLNRNCSAEDILTLE